MSSVHTVGHGTLPATSFSELVTGARISRVVDVRAFPGSRHNPQFRREEMEQWLPSSDVAYSWARDLGGRRRPVPGSKHVALRNDGFRAYADYMETTSFLDAVDQLVAGSDDTTAVMCSETVWWRCHRRLLADHLVLVRGIEVIHLMHDGRLTPHAPTEGVRLVDGALIYDVGGTPPLALD